MQNELKKLKVSRAVSLAGMPAETADALRKAVPQFSDTVHAYPLKKTINFLGSDAAAPSELRHSPKNPGWAMSFVESEFGSRAILFNQDRFAASDIFKRINEDGGNGYHPPGCNSVASLLDHEYAHLLFNEYRLQEDKRLMRFVALLRTKKHRKTIFGRVSGYAAEIARDEPGNFAQEVFAEAFSAVRASERPGLALTPEQADALRLHKLLVSRLDKAKKRAMV